MNTSVATRPPNAPAAAASRSIITASGPTFREVLLLSKAVEYAVVYEVTERYGRDTFSGEQSWFVKPPRARFDFSSDVGGQSTKVSLFALVEGTFLCDADVAQARCFSMSGRSTALQQNTAASVQESLVQQPERFDGVLTEMPQIAGEQAYCYDVRARTPQASGLTNGRFCYSALGVPLLSRFKTQGSEVLLEATRVSTTVTDSDFALPAEPTTLGRP